MRADIFYKSSGEIFISKDISNKWMIKIPTNKHGLTGAGTCSLKLVEYQYDLKEKEGILYIDAKLGKYVFIPNIILKEHPPEPKTFMGMKNSLFVFNIGQIINRYNFSLQSIAEKESLPEAYDQGIAGDVRRKFGL